MTVAVLDTCPGDGQLEMIQQLIREMHSSAGSARVSSAVACSRFSRIDYPLSPRVTGRPGNQNALGQSGNCPCGSEDFTRHCQTARWSINAYGANVTRSLREVSWGQPIYARRRCICQVAVFARPDQEYIVARLRTSAYTVSQVHISTVPKHVAVLVLHS